MKYYSNNELVTWFKRSERQNLKITILLIIFACLAGAGFFFDAQKEIDNKFIFGVGGLVLIIVFFLYAYLNSGSLTNKTIREISFTDSEITFCTFSYKLFALYTIEEKEIIVDSLAFKFIKSEYPVNNKKIKLQKECFIITNNGIEFFLLFKYFNDDLLNQIKNE
ncbi:hypothetical protein CLU81_3672 [Flavobacterium sp. 9]|uniref:hypothetical protein n=1 Tax=Flavobacterium sp. 9 TaxID=2035198 RepID=UPI000C1A8A86|nr:hypothetical protein [Flavobacterium sp. 9]PIF33098.1 hypothetical protein CLU81_3672 [Flavobacterium sp. 9]